MVLWTRDAAAVLNRNRARLRIPLLIFAVLIFVTGIAISARELPLDFSKLRIIPLLVIAFAIVPASIAYSSFNMMLMGKAIGVRVDFMSGVRTSVFAQVAELLPIPGGTIVRTAALMKGGGGALRSTGIVMAFALLWIACAAIGGGFALKGYGHIGMAMLAVGLIAALALNFWLGRKFSWTIAIGATLLRVLGLILVVTRMIFAFAVLAIVIEWSDAFGFAFGVILGSAASILPAGLGIGEGISALLAIPLNVDPAAAFLAVGLARLIGLIGNMLLASVFLAMTPKTEEGAADVQ